jgi:hypothetical protein
VFNLFISVVLGAAGRDGAALHDAGLLGCVGLPLRALLAAHLLLLAVACHSSLIRSPYPSFVLSRDRPLLLSASFRTDAYNERVERQGMGVMLTEGQREWVKAQLHLLHDLPEKRSQAPSSRWRRRIHAVVTVRCRIQTQQESADAGTRRGIHAVERGRSGLGAA